MFKFVSILSMCCVVIINCTPYNPTNFKLSVKQEKCAGNRDIELPRSRHHFFGNELDYAVTVEMKYPPLYVVIDNDKKYVQQLEFELYKEKDTDSYYITYSIDILRDSFFQSMNYIAMSWNVPIEKSTVNAILAKTPRLNERNPQLHGWYLPHLSFLTDENLQVFRACVEILNTVLPRDRKLNFDNKDLDAQYTSWLSAKTWRRKILGL